MSKVEWYQTVPSPASHSIVDEHNHHDHYPFLEIASIHHGPVIGIGWKSPSLVVRLVDCYRTLQSPETIASNHSIVVDHKEMEVMA